MECLICGCGCAEEEGKVALLSLISNVANVEQHLTCGEKGDVEKLMMSVKDSEHKSVCGECYMSVTAINNAASNYQKYHALAKALEQRRKSNELERAELMERFRKSSAVIKERLEARLAEGVSGRATNAMFALKKILEAGEEKIREDVDDEDERKKMALQNGLSERKLSQAPLLAGPSGENGGHPVTFGKGQKGVLKIHERQQERFKLPKESDIILRSELGGPSGGIMKNLTLASLGEPFERPFPKETGFKSIIKGRVVLGLEERKLSDGSEAVFPTAAAGCGGGGGEVAPPPWIPVENPILANKKENKADDVFEKQECLVTESNGTRLSGEIMPPPPIVIKKTVKRDETRKVDLLGILKANAAAREPMDQGEHFCIDLRSGVLAYKNASVSVWGSSLKCRDCEFVVKWREYKATNNSARAAEMVEAMLVHVREFHVFKCTQCGMEFSHKSSLQRHKKKVCQVSA